MGNLIRTFVLALSALAVLVAGGVTASAGGGEEWRTGKRCTENSTGIKRCAFLHQYYPSRVPRQREFQAEVSVAEASDRQDWEMKVRARVVLFQRQTDDGWRTVVRRKQRNGWSETSQLGWTNLIRCRAIRKGTYRSRGLVHWKHPDNDVYSKAWITSTGVGKRWFC